MLIVLGQPRASGAPRDDQAFFAEAGRLRGMHQTPRSAPWDRRHAVATRILVQRRAHLAWQRRRPEQRHRHGASARGSAVRPKRSAVRRAFLTAAYRSAATGARLTARPNGGFRMCVRVGCTLIRHVPGPTCCRVHTLSGSPRGSPPRGSARLPPKRAAPFEGGEMGEFRRLGRSNP